MRLCSNRSDAVLVFYESPNRIVSALEAVAEAFSLRNVAVCRELTKIHEEVVRGLSGEVAQEFAKRAAEGQVKGEIVLVIDAPSTAEVDAQASASAHDAREEAAALLAPKRRSLRIFGKHTGFRATMPTRSFTVLDIGAPRNGFMKGSR